MCILSIVKTEDHKCRLTFTRDESSLRTFDAPFMDEQSVFCAIDTQGGGTWIGHNQQKIVMIQNGGSIPHSRELPYSLSRGKLVLDLLHGNDYQYIYNQLNSNKVEPFTITVLGRQNFQIEHLVYDAKSEDRFKIVDSDKFLSLSSTLYHNEIGQTIRNDFSNTALHTREELMQFHIDRRIGTDKGLQRTEPQSTCLHSYELSENSLDLIIYDYLNDQSYRHKETN